MKHYTHNYPFDSNRSQVQGEITNFFHWFYHNAIYHLKTFTNSQKMCVEEKAKWMKHDFIFYIHLRIYNIMYNLIFINIILFPPVPCWVKLHKGTKIHSSRQNIIIHHRQIHKNTEKWAIFIMIYRTKEAVTCICNRFIPLLILFTDRIRWSLSNPPQRITCVITIAHFAMFHCPELSGNSFEGDNSISANGSRVHTPSQAPARVGTVDWESLGWPRIGRTGKLSPSGCDAL